MSDLAKGLYFKEPHQNAPDFVKGRLSVKNEDFIAFLKEQGGEWTNLQIKVSKAGKPYVEVDDWKPSEEGNGDLPF